MDAPKCKLCGKRHYGMCKGGDVPGSDKPIKMAKRTPLPKQTSHATAGEILDRLDDLDARVEKLETRKAYQREYMKKRRADS